MTIRGVSRMPGLPAGSMAERTPLRSLAACLLALFLCAAATTAVAWPPAQAYADELNVYPVDETPLTRIVEAVGGAAEALQASEEPAVLAANPLASYYVFDQLGEPDRFRYLLVYAACLTHGSVPYPDGDLDGLSRLYRCVLADHPELFDVIGASLSVTIDDQSGRSVGSAVLAAHAYTQRDADAIAQLVDERVRECLDGIPVDASDREKATYIYEYIIGTVSYDEDAPAARESDVVNEPMPDQTLEGAFVAQKAVCNGYASAFQYLAQRSGLQCVRITGTSPAGNAHAWCLVMLDGQPCYVDPTWGDPDSATDSGSLASSRAIDYDYLDLQANNLMDGRIPDVPFAVPAND